MWEDFVEEKVERSEEWDECLEGEIKGK